MNSIFIGLKKEIELPRGPFLYINDEVPDVARSRVFDPLRHSFNPLKNINYRSACDFVEIIGAIFPKGDNTLTKDTGLDYIHDALEAAPKTLESMIEPPDKKSSTGHQWSYSKVRRILRSHVLLRALCQPTNFSFKGMVFARINRAQLGDFDALVMGLFLMAHYKGQIIVPDGGFYLREMHISLIREGRLIAGCNFLSELPPKIRQSILLFDKRIVQGARLEDAELLADYSGLVKGTNDYSDFVAAGMRVSP